MSNDNKPIEELNRLARARSRNANITMGLFVLSFVALVAGFLMGFAYTLYLAAAILAASLVVAGLCVDRLDKQYYQAFEDAYMHPLFKETFSHYEYDRPDGFTKEEVLSMNLLERGRGFITRRRVTGYYKGVSFDACHLLFKRHARGKLSAEIRPSIQAQALKFSNLQESFPSMYIRPVGAGKNEGLRKQLARPESLVKDAGTAEFARIFEVLCEKDVDKLWLDEKFCGAILNYRALVRESISNASIFLHFYQNNVDIIIGNWDNSLMPPIKPGMSNRAYERYAQTFVSMVTDFWDTLAHAKIESPAIDAAEEAEKE